MSEPRTPAHQTLVALKDGPKSTDDLIAMLGHTDRDYLGILCRLIDLGSLVIVGGADTGDPMLDLNRNRYPIGGAS